MSADINKSKKWIAKAPSNIALIKYMGKTNLESNLPLNSSLSYSLDYLQSEVVVKLNEAADDYWEAWDSESIQLSSLGLEKFLKHWKLCRQVLAPHFRENFIISSRNHFPSDCGLASSASSFAALTLAAYNCFSDLKLLDRDWNVSELAQLSRAGSGSSCRSFYSSFVMWKGDNVIPVESAYQNLLHMVIVVDSRVKKVSSSEAHKRVSGSLLYQGRPERAERRVQDLLTALSKKNWGKIFEITWSDFWDMHILFETSSPVFSYMLPESLELIRKVQNLWEVQGDGPLITMDAGANVHLLYREDQKELAVGHKLEFLNRFKVFSNL